MHPRHVSKAMPNVLEWGLGKLYFLLSVNVRDEDGGFVPRSEVRLQLPRSIREMPPLPAGNYLNELADELL